MIKKPKLYLKQFDYPIIGIAVILIVLSLSAMFSNKKSGSHLIVTSPTEEYIYDLGSDKILGAQGPLGVSVITIHEGKAFFESSPCDNQICVLSHPISTNADFIACLPNQIFIRIEAEENNTNFEEPLDSIGY